MTSRSYYKKRAGVIERMRMVFTKLIFAIRFLFCAWRRRLAVQIPVFAAHETPPQTGLWVTQRVPDNANKSKKFEI
jgi:hypothetical protein